MSCTTRHPTPRKSFFPSAFKCIEIINIPIALLLSILIMLKSAHNTNTNGTISINCLETTQNFLMDVMKHERTQKIKGENKRTLK